MSLFIATLAFGESAQADVGEASILVASVIAGVAGWIVLRFGVEAPRARRERDERGLTQSGVQRSPVPIPLNPMSRSASAWREPVVEKATVLGNLDWSATGAGFFSTNRTPTGNELLFIRLDGTSQVLWSHQGTPVTALPSPDGTHLAIAGWTRQSNAWLLRDF